VNFGKEHSARNLTESCERNPPAYFDPSLLVRDRFLTKFRVQLANQAGRLVLLSNFGEDDAEVVFAVHLFLGKTPTFNKYRV